MVREVMVMGDGEVCVGGVMVREVMVRCVLVVR